MIKEIRVGGGGDMPYLQKKTLDMFNVILTLILFLLAIGLVIVIVKKYFL